MRAISEAVGPQGDAGPSGGVWRDGSGAPSNGLGVDGDYYIDNDSGDIYAKATGTYTVQMTVTRPAGPGVMALLAFPGSTWTIPASAGAFLGITSARVAVDLSGVSEWRLAAFITAAASAGSLVRGKYATTAGGALVDLGTGGDLEPETTGAISGAWTAIPVGAIGAVFVTVVGLDGDGVAESEIAYLGFEFR